MSKFYYNGVLLPEIPADVLEKFPYCWINSTFNGFIVAAYPWYYLSRKMYIPVSATNKKYKLSGDSWTLANTYTDTGGYTVDAIPGWSNHDITNGSATATGVYFSATEPIGENEVKAKSLKYETYTNFYPYSGNIAYEVDSLTINYIIPVTKYSTYTVTMTEIGNRLRCVFTTTDPSTIAADVTGCTDIVMDPAYDVGYEFSYMASENGWLVVYVSNAGETPAISIVTNGVGGDGSPLYDLLYLIRSEGIIYTIVDNMMKSLAETELTSEVFQTYGVDEIPEWSVISELTNPEILYWHDSLDDLPTITTTMNATPPTPQTIVSPNYNMTDDTILGVECAYVTASSDVVFAISVDDGVTWYMWTGESWGTLTDTATGMTAETINAITTEQWAGLMTTGQFKVRMTLFDENSSFTSFVMDYIN